ncbi:MAG: CRISPR-associated endonuclease Cas1 [Dehalococcoidia bacterium]|nr:CRISPR-associated endonuclease Cas1 [Dehalococcoidia bacterium]
MRIVHLSEAGGELRVEGQRLLAVRNGAVVAAVRLPQVRTLVLHGAQHLSGPALARLLTAGVEVVFLTHDGRYRGRLETVPSSAALLRMTQASVAADAGRRLGLARAVVCAKLESQRRVLRALRREPPAAWWQAVRLLGAATAIAELSGAEGWASRAYFGVLRAVLPQVRDEPRWRRRRRPAPDPVNALLSYGYTLLLARMHTAVLVEGLDPYLGMLHTPGRARPALVLDLMEEFRAPLVDFTVVRLLRRLSTGDEGWWEPTDQGVRLSWEVRCDLIAAFERRLNAHTRDVIRGGRAPWWRVIERQVEAFGRALRLGPGAYRAASAEVARRRTHG